MNHLKITTAELATICGVSQGTIDRALNNRSDIKPETKEKILKIAKLYGYREYIHSNTPIEITEQIGIIIFNLNNEYFSQLVMEIENILKKIGMCAVIMLTHYDKHHEIECIRKMYNMGVKGIILCSVNSGDEFVNYLNMFDIPIVAVGNRIDKIPYSGIDDFKAMYDMTNQMIDDGYKRFVYFSPALKYDDAYAQKMRYLGFLKAVGSFPNETVTDIEDLDDIYGKESVVVCSSDYYSFLAYARVKNSKITGFDNTDAIKKYKFSIDSVDYSFEEIAKGAVSLITQPRSEDIVVKHTIVRYE